MRQDRQQGISRRNFLSGTAAAAMAAAAGTALMGCTKNSTSTSPESTNSIEPSWFTKPDPIPASSIIETIDTEVLVIGAGNSGVATACSAAENGAKVTVIEKTTTVNGRGGGVGACNSRLNKELGFEIEPVAAQYRWNRTCGNRNNEALVTQWFHNSGVAMNWLLDKADKYGATYTLYAGYSRSRILPEEPDFHTFSKGTFNMPAEAGYFVPTGLLYQACLDNGNVSFLFEYVAEQLLQDVSGRVTGAIVNTVDGYKQINASKAVVLASGDIHGDAEMLKYYCEDIVNQVPGSAYSPVGANTGDGQKMGMWIGGVMQDSPLPAALHPQGGTTFHGPFMFVNKEGKRFFNEANWVQSKTIQVTKQTDHIAYSIFDADFGAQDKVSLNYGGGMFWDTMSRSVTEEFDPTEIEKTVESEVENGKTAWKANTLEELADAIGVDKDNFLTTVKHYNEMVTAGEDTDFEKESVFLYPVEKAPFYATKVSGQILVIVGGLKINTNLQVVDKNGSAIEGLYAVGNTSGDLYAVDYPINMPGNSNGRCLTWGYLCGRTVTSS